MSFPVKACVIGGLGCVASIAYGLSQAESSLSVRERLAFEGYELISFKDNVAKDAWKERANAYKKSGENSSLLLKDLLPNNVDDEGEAIKKKCEDLTDIKVSYNSIKDIYEKVIKLCTLNIKEYVQSNLNKEDKFISKAPEGEQDWQANFKKHEDKIKKEITDAKDSNAKEKLSEYCEKSYSLQYYRKTKQKTSNVADWCVKKKEEAPKADET